MINLKSIFIFCLGLVTGIAGKKLDDEFDPKPTSPCIPTTTPQTTTYTMPAPYGAKLREQSFAAEEVVRQMQEAHKPQEGRVK